MPRYEQKRLTAILKCAPPSVKQTDEKRELGHEGLVPESEGSQLYDPGSKQCF